MPIEFWVAVGAFFVFMNSVTGFVTLFYARRTEINTNSMKDALVARTAEASEAKGRDDQRVVSEAKAAAIVAGRAQVQAEATPVQGAVATPIPVEVVQPEHAPVPVRDISKK